MLLIEDVDCVRRVRKPSVMLILIKSEGLSDEYAAQSCIEVIM